MRPRRSPQPLLLLIVVLACSPVALDDQCHQRLSYPTDVDIGVTWEERLPGWELIAMPDQYGAQCPLSSVDVRGRASAVGSFAQNRTLRGLMFYVVQKEVGHAWGGFEDTGLYTCGAGSKVWVKLRTRMGSDGQPTLVGTYVTKGCRPELDQVTVALRRFEWPPYVRCCGTGAKSRGEE